MTPLDSSLDVPNVSPVVLQTDGSIHKVSTLKNEDMNASFESESLPSPKLTNDIGSDYGDFASDEEELINGLLANVGTRGETEGAALLVTDIEDYEGPKGIRLPKVLGFERGPPTWLSLEQGQIRQQALRDSSSTQVVSSEAREAQRNLERQHSTPQASVIDPTIKDARSPLERFRRPPKKALSVTDLVSPAWCELQYFYTLAKHGRKKRTPAMRQGSMIHKVLEDEVHTTVAVDITTKEDSWGLRVWNIVQGLRTLRDTGRTRELETWGIIGGEVVNGIIDELTYECPDSKLEAEIDERYANARTDRDTLPEYQTSITGYLLSPVGGRQSTADDGGEKTGRESRQAMRPPPVPGKQQEHLVYITDVKTRSVKTLPTGSSIRPTILQLHLYHHMLENLAQDNFPLQALADRYDLDINSTFSDSFIAQVGSLNQDFFDTLSQQLGGVEDKVAASQIASSQDSTDLLLKHNNLSSLWSFMVQQLQETFLLNPTFSVPSTPSSTPQSIRDTPSPATCLSPILTARYLSSTSSAVIGSKSILFDASLLKGYLEDNLAWWRGDREARGVELQEAWKCRSCVFRDDCSWIHERDAAAVAEVKARKKMRDTAGVDRKKGKSEV